MMFLIPGAFAETAEQAASAAEKAVDMNINIGGALTYALIGFLIVFIALFIIIGAIKLTSIFVSRNEKKEVKPAVQAPAAAAPAPAPSAPAAPGSCGELKLYNVSDKDAAMIMAIVADELKTPLNELHFISIKEIA